MAATFLFIHSTTKLPHQKASLTEPQSLDKWNNFHICQLHYEENVLCFAFLDIINFNVYCC